MQIQLNLTAEDLNDQATRNVLLALAGQTSDRTADETPLTAEQPVEATTKPAAAKPAPKAKPAAAEPEVADEPEDKPAPKAKPAAAKPAPKAKPAAAEPEEPTPGSTPKDAISRATKLVSAGKTARVKAVLSELGAKKVSDLKGAKIAQFIELTEEDVEA